MGSETAKHARNAAIVVALALVVWLLPGGGQGAELAFNVVSVLLGVGLFVFAVRLYREWRVSLLDAPVRTRGALYGSLALAAFALVAADRFWDSGLGALAWLALVGAAVYGGVVAVRELRTL